MRILGFDISSASTGWAILEDGQLPVEGLGLIKMKHKSHGERLCIFEAELDALFRLWSPDLIAVEDVWGGKFIQPALILSRYRGKIKAG